jgi:transcriptional regulator GlxA family with amidase domain
MARKDRKLIAFATYPGIAPLELVGPLTVLRDLRIGTPFRSIVVGESVTPLATDTPLGVVPQTTFSDVPAPFALFVPGGGTAAEAAMGNERLIDWVRRAAATATIVGSTGNGALILGAAGLLERRRVAAHWAWADLLAAFGATYVADRWVEDGRFLTAAGGTAGIDAMLHLTARLRSESAARVAQLWMEYDPQPPFGRPPTATYDGDLGRQLRARRPDVPRNGGMSHDGA